MASRKVAIDVKVRLVLRVDEGIEVSQVVDELEYSFSDQTGFAQIEDETIEDYEIIDSY